MVGRSSAQHVGIQFLSASCRHVRVSNNFEFCSKRNHSPQVRIGEPSAFHCRNCCGSPHVTITGHRPLATQVFSTGSINSEETSEFLINDDQSILKQFCPTFLRISATGCHEAMNVVNCCMHRQFQKRICQDST